MAAPPATGQVFRGVKHIGPISDMPPHRAAGLILWGIRYNLNRTPPMRIAFVRERMAVTGRPVIDDIVGLMMTMPDIADEVAAIDIPKFIAVGEQDLWPEEQHRGVRRAHRRAHRGVPDRPRAVRDGAAPARARHARALRRRLSGRSGPVRGVASGLRGGFCPGHGTRPTMTDAGLTLGVIGTSRKPDERRVPIHPGHFERLPDDLRARVIVEEGYGERFGIVDDELRPFVGRFASRDEVIAASDVVLLPKPQLEDLREPP